MEFGRLMIPFPSRTDPVDDDEVGLELLDSGSDEAALSTTPSIDLTSDANIHEHDSLVLKEAGTYVFRAFTTDVANPAPSFLWQRRTTENDAGGTEEDMEDAADNTAIAFPAVTHDDTWTLTGVTYDMYDGKFIHVTVDNTHDADGVSSWVKLDVHGKLLFGTVKPTVFHKEEFSCAKLNSLKMDDITFLLL